VQVVLASKNGAIHQELLNHGESKHRAYHEIQSLPKRYHIINRLAMVSGIIIHCPFWYQKWPFKPKYQQPVMVRPKGSPQLQIMELDQAAWMVNSIALAMGTIFLSFFLSSTNP